MSYTIFEQVKIRLRQFHIDEKGTENEKIVFDKPEDNPVLEQLISLKAIAKNRLRKT